MYNILVLFIIFLTPLSIGCGKKDITEDNLRYIKSIKVEKQFLYRKRRFSGISKFDVETNLSFQVPGQIKSIQIKLGDPVKKEQIIAVLDDDDYKADLDSAKSEYEYSKNDLERLRALYENEHISQQEFDQSKRNLDVYLAKYTTAKDKFSYTSLKSPIEGIITKKYVNEHEYVSAGQTIVKIESERSTLEVQVGVPEVFINNIKLGDLVKIYFETIKGPAFDGEIYKISYALDETTATFPVIVKVNTSGEQGFYSGMVADIEFSFSKQSDAPSIFIPIVAILEDLKTNKFVWIYNPIEKTVSKRKVITGNTYDDVIEITSGLNPGDIIAVAGAHYLEDGQKVNLLD